MGRSWRNISIRTGGRRLADLAPRESSICLCFVDPYGDATFNQLQLPDLILEVEAAVSTSPDPETRRVASEVVRLAKLAASRVHTYIKFIGD
jgi:hypothetical protein